MTGTAKRIGLGLLAAASVPLLLAVVALQTWNAYFFGKLVLDGVGSWGSAFIAVGVSLFGVWIALKAWQAAKLAWMLLFRPSTFVEPFWQREHTHHQ
jgi:hypothetical protein